MVYTPVTFNPGGPPGINADFLNNTLQAFLASINSAAIDSHVTSDGSGNVTVVTLTFTHGRISQISHISGTGPQTGITHGCSSTPWMGVFYNPGASDFGTAPTTIPYAWNIGLSTCNIKAQSAYNWWALAIVF